MRAAFVIPFVICLTLTAGSIALAFSGGSASMSALMNADPHKELLRAEQTVEALYSAVYEGNRQTAYLHAQKLNKLIYNERLYVYGTPEGWVMMARDAAIVEQGIKSGAPSSSWEESATRLRLAFDALLRPETALWLQYKPLLLDDSGRVQQSFKRQAGDPAAAAAAVLHRLKTRAERIEPAVYAAGGGERMERLLERVAYSSRMLQGNETRASGELKDRNAEASLVAIDAAVRELFEPYAAVEAKAAVALPGLANPLRWTLLLGTIITAVLSYAGWRKYKQNPFGVKPLH